MKIDGFKTPRVGHLIFTFRYEPYLDIERLIYDFENKFSNLFQGNRAELTRLPQNAPIELPRFILKNSKGKQLEVAISESRLSFSLPDKDIDSIESILKKNTDSIFNYFKTHNEINLDSFASQAALQVPSKSIDRNIHDELFEKYLKIDKPEKLITTSFMYEEMKNGVSISYTIGHYQNASFNFPHPTQMKPNTFVKVSMDDTKINEKGLVLNIAIKNNNDKNESEKKDLKEVYELLIAETIKQIKSSPKRFLS